MAYDGPMMEKPSREKHHIAFDKELGLLEDEIGRLEAFLYECREQSESSGSNKMPQAPRLYPSLSQFLQSGSSRAAGLRKRICEVIDGLRSELM